MQLKEGMVFRYKNSIMDEPEFYVVNHCVDANYGGGEWVCWRNNYILESRELILSDLWRITQRYFNQCIEDGEITITQQ